jgi:hypothetical protein
LLTLLERQVAQHSWLNRQYLLPTMESSQAAAVVVAAAGPGIKIYKATL